MATETLCIELSPAEGAVQRLLGLVERRGYELKTIDMPSAGAGPLRLTLGVEARDPGRRIDVLGRQIARLYGIRRIMTVATHSQVLVDAHSEEDEVKLEKTP